MFFVIFSDPAKIKRTAMHISWFTDGPKKLAIAYSSIEFEGSPYGSNMESYVWDVGE